MRTMGFVFLMLIGFVAFLGLGFAVKGYDFFMFQFWAPKYTTVQRQVFENTKSYTQGTIQELRSQQTAYINADDAHKDALASLILHQVADYPVENLPGDLQDFVKELKSRQGFKQ